MGQSIPSHLTLSSRQCHYTKHAASSCVIVLHKLSLYPVSHGSPGRLRPYCTIIQYGCNDGGAWSVVARTIKCEVTLYSSQLPILSGSPCSSPASYRLVVALLKTAHRRPPVLSRLSGLALSCTTRRGRTLCEARISKRSHDVSHLREATGIANCGMMVHTTG